MSKRSFPKNSNSTLNMWVAHSMNTAYTGYKTGACSKPLPDVYALTASRIASTMYRLFISLAKTLVENIITSICTRKHLHTCNNGRKNDVAKGCATIKNDKLRPLCEFVGNYHFQTHMRVNISNNKSSLQRIWNSLEITQVDVFLIASKLQKMSSLKKKTKFSR